MTRGGSLVLTLLGVLAIPGGSAAQALFVSDRPLEAMQGKQAVVETDLGAIVIQLLPEVAPNHVAHFMMLAEAGDYDGTVFHRLIKYGIVQGGDPISKDPAQRDQYGTGGLGRLAAERSGESHTRGAVAAVLRPNEPDSAGAQFFICVTDQTQLDGQYTVFGRVVEGLEVVQRISEGAADAEGRASERIEMRTVRIRDTPPPEPTPFVDESREELSKYRATLETSLGAITLEFFPEKAEQHVRSFLRLAEVGAYDGVAFHRVVPGFVIQTGSMAHRREPLTARQERHVGELAPEFNDTLHVKGIVSMARGEAAASATTSFFICTAPAPSLDGTYTAFGRVVEGLGVVDAIEAVPVDGDAPVERVELIRVHLTRVP